MTWRTRFWFAAACTGILAVGLVLAQRNTRAAYDAGYQLAEINRDLLDTNRHLKAMCEQSEGYSRAVLHR